MTEAVLGKDIALKNADVQFSNNQDFQTITFKDNLGQAIINRIQTAKGEYYNTEYGSEVNKTIGV